MNIQDRKFSEPKHTENIHYGKISTLQGNSSDSTQWCRLINHRRILWGQSFGHHSCTPETLHTIPIFIDLLTEKQFCSLMLLHGNRTGQNLSKSILMTYPNFCTTRISLRLTFSAVAGSMTLKTASTVIGARRFEY